MPSEGYVSDVAALALRLASDPELRQLFDGDPPGVDEDSLTLSLHVPHDGASNLTVAMQAVQVAVDAAELAAEYLARGRYDEDEGERLSWLKKIQEELGPVDLELVSAERNTWEFKLKLKPRTAQTLRRLAIVAGLAASALAIVGIATGIAGVAVAGVAADALARVLDVVSKVGEKQGLPPNLVVIDLGDLPPGTTVKIEIALPDS